MVNKTAFWISDPAMHIVYRGTVPRSLLSSAARRTRAQGVPSIATIQSDLNKLIKHLNVSGAIPGDVAGQPAYTVRVSPSTTVVCSVRSRRPGTRYAACR